MFAPLSLSFPIIPTLPTPPADPTFKVKPARQFSSSHLSSNAVQLPAKQYSQPPAFQAMHFGFQQPLVTPVIVCCDVCCEKGRYSHLQGCDYEMKTALSLDLRGTELSFRT